MAMHTEHQSAGSRIKQWLEERLGPNFPLLVGVCGMLSVLNGNAVLTIEQGLTDIESILRFGFFFCAGGTSVFLCMSLRGTFRQRMQTYLTAYLIVACGLFATAIFRYSISASLPSEARLIIGAYLLGISLSLSKKGLLGRIGSLNGVKYILSVMPVVIVVKASVLALKGELPMEPEFDTTVIFGLGASLLCGMTLSFTGLLIGLLIDDEAVLVPMRTGASLSLAVTAWVSYLSLDLPRLVVQGAHITLPPLIATFLPISIGMGSTLYLAICAWAKARRPRHAGEARLHVVKPIHGQPSTSKLENANG